MPDILVREVEKSTITTWNCSSDGPKRRAVLFA